MVYVIQVCCVYSKKTPDEGQKNCPKHVEFHSKNKFEKLGHLVGFIIRKEKRVCILVLFVNHANCISSTLSYIVICGLFSSAIFSCINSLITELNPSKQRCLLGFFTGDFKFY